jgi:ATP-dependent DNA ligase
MKLPMLFKRTETGATQQWQVIVDGNTYRTVSGQVDGKLVESTPTVVSGKNVGSSNETTPAQQAEKEAQAKWKKKLEQGGYREEMGDIDDGSKFFEPMLANKWEDRKDKVSFPLFSQPKLDGMRCIIKKDGMWSRKGKKIVSAPHIFEELKSIFSVIPNVIFDGELYADKLAQDFSKIISLAKKTKPTDEDLKESKDLLEYHIYDFPSSSTFSERNKNLFSTITKLMASNRNSKIRFVETTKVANQDELDTLFASYLKQGYEGQIVRIDDCHYENRRTNQLLKRKNFMDDEFEILDIVEGTGNRSGMAGMVIFKTKDGIESGAGIKGTEEFFTELLKNKKKYIGKKATIKYFGWTPDGKARMGTMVTIRNYE